MGVFVFMDSPWVGWDLAKKARQLRSARAARVARLRVRLEAVVDESTRWPLVMSAELPVRAALSSTLAPVVPLVAALPDMPFAVFPLVLPVVLPVAALGWEPLASEGLPLDVSFWTDWVSCEARSAAVGPVRTTVAVSARGTAFCVASRASCEVVPTVFTGWLAVLPVCAHAPAADSARAAATDKALMEWFDMVVPPCEGNGWVACNPGGLAPRSGARTHKGGLAFLVLSLLDRRQCSAARCAGACTNFPTARR